MFRSIAAVAVEDGIALDPASVKVEEIREESGYAGARVLITGELAKARCRAQVDTGFGDAVTPGPVRAVFPVLIADFPAPQLRIYPAYTVIAEKLHAITLLGMTNTRLKDKSGFVGSAGARGAGAYDLGESDRCHVHASGHGGASATAHRAER